ncbi:Uncharacterised protein [uncultured Clostridium sp.]|nr:Uncharacterised protein [uncultured Clostridium sp.]
MVMKVVIPAMISVLTPQNKHTFFIFCPKIANEYDFEGFLRVCHKF